MSFRRLSPHGAANFAHVTAQQIKPAILLRIGRRYQVWASDARRSAISPAATWSNRLCGQMKHHGEYRPRLCGDMANVAAVCASWYQHVRASFVIVALQRNDGIITDVAWRALLLSPVAAFDAASIARRDEYFLKWRRRLAGQA